MTAGSFVVVGSPSIHRIPLSRILESTGMTVRETDGPGSVLQHLSEPGVEVRAVVLDLTRPSHGGRTLVNALRREKKIPVFGIVNPLTMMEKDTLAADCDDTFSVFDTPERILGGFSRALFNGHNYRRNKRVEGYWTASLRIASNHVIPCRATDISREGAFVQTDWSPMASETPVDLTIRALPDHTFRARSIVIYHKPCTGRIVLGGVGLRFLEAQDEAGTIVSKLAGGTAPVEVPGRPSILIADDEPTIRTLVGRIFAGHGWETVTVAGGTEAVESASRRRFDAVLLDIEMPSVGGVDALKRIRPLLPSASFALMTGGGVRVQGLIQEARRDGPLAVLAKPFSLEELLRTFPKPR